ncbi:MAG: NTP transferase domain-containing protein [Candidatus Kaiserbacteria bacterium]|nr:MAG: NTP transferase domain-containing protein [Candidatus Kaiserbacteria bacterium]
MQAVILAAGKGERMGKLTESLPKPLLTVGGKTLLEHKFDMLPNNVDEIILVVRYLGSAIHDRFGGVYKDKRILYVEQEKFNGSAGALWYARGVLHDQFIVMNADDLYDKEDVIRISTESGWALSGKEMDDLGSAGKIVVDKDGLVEAIQEHGAHDGTKGFINTGLYMLDMRIFETEPVPKVAGSDELGLPQTMVAAGLPIRLVPARFWMQITTPEDLEKAEKILEKS